MKIAIANDHGGTQLKHTILQHLSSQGIEVINLGIDDTSSVDYPDYAKKVTDALIAQEADLGILCCGTGIGMSIAANKVAGIRAAVVSDTFSAQATREHNHSNVLCLGQRVIGEGLALLLVDTWLAATPQEGRHLGRVAKLEG
ncbi:MAG: ribose 5-phosphate isomerase B [Neisseriaceae bacterium]|nr:ribose 5-phosphate isomerase B [Neisseriaceae bacterium]MBP6862700.1 ribose 5-phosphate isomerase B [Neisseriaceae bacterium]